MPDFVSQRRPARSGVQVVVNEDNIVDVQADYDGPGASPASCARRPPPASAPWPTAARPGSDHVARGAAGTPFEGGVFRMKLVLGADFPDAPPKGARRRCPARPALGACRFTACGAEQRHRLLHCARAMVPHMWRRMSAPAPLSSVCGVC